MTVAQCLYQRKSIRVFTERPLPPGEVRYLLEQARWAPSGVNTQPWEVAVVEGETLTRLCDAVSQAFRAESHEEPDYRYYPDRWEEPFRSRRKACGLDLYGALGIGMEDKSQRREQWAANYRAFGAPVLLLFFLDARLETGSFMDYGMFLQSLMLLAVERGLGTCPQAAFAEYPETIKRVLGYPREKRLLCGMALGYPDEDHPVNQYRTRREPVSTFTRFFR